MQRLFFSSTLGLLVALSLLPCARAKKPMVLDKAAKKACLTGDFRKGVEILTQLYIDTDDPTYLFNQGRCYEQNHQWQEALDAFREYKRKATKLTKAAAADTEKHMADCELFLAKEEAKKSAQLVPASPSPAGVVGDAAAQAEVPGGQPIASQPAAVVATVAVPATPSENPGVGLRTLGGVLAGVGAASVLTGVLLNLKANSLADEINQHYSQSKVSTRSSYETWGYVVYGVGATAIVGGATLYYLGWRSARTLPPNARVSLVPMLTPDSQSLVLHGSF